MGFALVSTCLKLTEVQWGITEESKLPQTLISPIDHVRTCICLFLSRPEKKLKHLQSSLLR